MKFSLSGSLERIRYPYHHQSLEDVVDVLQDGIYRAKRKAIESVKVIPITWQVGLDLREKETESEKEYQTDNANHCCPFAKNKPPMKKVIAQCPTCIEQQEDSFDENVDAEKYSMGFPRNFGEGYLPAAREQERKQIITNSKTNDIQGKTAQKGSPKSSCFGCVHFFIL